MRRSYRLSMSAGRASFTERQFKISFKVRTLIRILLLLLLILFFAWYVVWNWPPELPKEVSKGLDAASAVTLYSLQPRGGPDLPEWDFHGHHILGHVNLSGVQ